MKQRKYWLMAFIALLLGACTVAPTQLASTDVPAQAGARYEEKLGTQWGDEVAVNFQQVDLRRKSEQVLDEQIVEYRASPVAGTKIRNISLVAGKISFAVQDDAGQPLPLVRQQGKYYLQGKAGQAYQLVYENHSAQIYQIVASVDGLNVLTGEAASRQGRGYVLRPHSKVVITGFRKSDDAVASFIFSAPSEAYAAHTPQGSPVNVGLIGMAIFELYDPHAKAAPQASAFPADDYAQPPR